MRNGKDSDVDGKTIDGDNNGDDEMDVQLKLRNARSGIWFVTISIDFPFVSHQAHYLHKHI